MKLNFLFIVMYILTLLAYPVVFVHIKLRQFYRSKENIPVRNFLVPVPVTTHR